MGLLPSCAVCGRLYCDPLSRPFGFQLKSYPVQLDSRGTFHILSRDPSFQENITAGF